MKANRFLLFILACILSLGTGWAKQQTFYYKYTAKTSTGNTTYGSVYANTTGTAPTKDTDYKASISPNSTQSVSGYTAPSITVYLWAKPASGYTLEKWTGSDGSTLYGTQTSGEFTASSTSSGSPTSVTYTAYFKKLGVLRVFADNGGAAYVSKIDNDNGETVTLEAYNLYDYKFTGWMHNGSIVSTEKTLQVTVPNLATGEHDDWTATFAEQSIKYYRLRSDKGYYLSIVGNQGSQLTHTSSGKDYLDGCKLNGTIKLISTNVQNDPSTILKVTHGTQTSGVYSDFDIEAQGIKLTSVIKNALSSQSGADVSEKFTLISDGKGGYKIKNAEQGYFLQGVGNDGNGYLVGEDYSNAKNDTWYFEPVDGSTNTANLAVTAEKQIDDKYYATLFVPFPFQCASGMKAYYVADIVDDVAECNTNGITSVPAFTPIILEWTAGNGYIVPINTDNTQVGDVTSNAITQGWWKGCINLYTTGGKSPVIHTCYFDRSGNMTDAGKTLTFDNAIMRVMDAEGGSLVMNKNFTQGANMPSNKSYVEKDPVKDLYMVIFPLELDESLETDRGLNAIFAEVTVKRTFTGSSEGEEWGNWNTLCLPFDLDETEIASLFGECELKALNNFWVTDDGTLHLRFKDVAEIECGQPYMIRVKKNIADLALHNKRVNTEKDNKLHLSGDDYTMDFQGSYDYFDGTSGNYVPRDAFIISKNLFYHVASNVKMKGFRAYFMPQVVNPAKSPVKAMKFAEGEPTGISNISFEGLEGGTIYNAQGLRLNSMQRGINIVNGKKIIR